MLILACCQGLTAQRETKDTYDRNKHYLFIWPRGVELLLPVQAPVKSKTMN